MYSFHIHTKTPIAFTSHNPMSFMLAVTSLLLTVPTESFGLGLTTGRLVAANCAPPALPTCSSLSSTPTSDCCPSEIALSDTSAGTSTTIVTACFHGCTSFAGPLVIPSIVRTISDFSFSGTGISSLKIEDGVIAVGSYSFYQCNSLTSGLFIPPSVTTISQYAFFGTAVTNLTISPGVSYIGSKAFSQCSRLASVVLPNSLSVLGDNAFSSSGIASLVLSSSLTSISASAFSSCANLGGVITIPDSVTEISSAAFSSTAITSVRFGSQLLSVGYGAFQRCGKLRGHLVIPDSITSLGDLSFKQTAINQLTLGSKVEYIGQYAFGNTISNSLAGHINIPASTKVLGNYAFYSSAIKALTISPGLLTAIGQHAFELCTKLSGNLLIPATVTSVGTYAFYKTAIQYLYIGTKVAAIGPSAFAACTNLSSIFIDAVNITFFAADAFLGSCGSSSLQVQVTFSSAAMYGKYRALFTSWGCRTFLKAFPSRAPTPSPTASKAPVQQNANTNSAGLSSSSTTSPIYALFALLGIILAGGLGYAYYSYSVKRNSNDQQDEAVYSEAPAEVDFVNQTTKSMDLEIADENVPGVDGSAFDALNEGISLANIIKTQEVSVEENTDSVVDPVC